LLVDKICSSVCPEHYSVLEETDGISGLESRKSFICPTTQNVALLFVVSANSMHTPLLRARQRSIGMSISVQPCITQWGRKRNRQYSVAIRWWGKETYVALFQLFLKKKKNQLLHPTCALITGSQDPGRKPGILFAFTAEENHLGMERDLPSSRTKKCPFMASAFTLQADQSCASNNPLSPETRVQSS